MDNFLMLFDVNFPHGAFKWETNIKVSTNIAFN